MDQDTTPVDKSDDAMSSQKNYLDFLYGREIQWPVYGSEKRILNITSSGFNDVQLSSELDVRYEIVNRVVRDPANGA